MSGVATTQMTSRESAMARLPFEIESYEVLLKSKANLEASLEANKDEIKKQRARVCQTISDAGMQNYSYNGFTYTPGITHKYYLISETDAYDNGIDDRFAPFEEDSYLCNLVKKDINWRSMQTMLRELEESEYGIPENVKSVLNIKDEFGISRRKANTQNAEKVAAALKIRRNN